MLVTEQILLSSGTQTLGTLVKKGKNRREVMEGVA